MDDPRNDPNWNDLDEETRTELMLMWAADQKYEDEGGK